MRHLLILCIVSAGVRAQISGQWELIKGDTTLPLDVNIYGIQGIPDSLNEPKGRYESAEFKDTAGNFWLYGGSDAGGDPAYNDLWKYDVLANEWIFIKGDTVPEALPKYGVKGIPADSNSPGPRIVSVSWVDLNNNFWIYGGEGRDETGGQNIKGDLWKYDPITNQWAWMHGSKGNAPVPIYGIKGVSDSVNTPGTRWEVTASWTDDSNNLWLFGGAGAFAPNPWNGTGNLYNDLWKYNIATNQWTWVHGDSGTDHPGEYGIKGIASPANRPGARYAYAKWKDTQGNFWLYGSLGADGDTSNGYLNDLWKYNPLTNEWTWVHGDSIADAVQYYCKPCHYDPANTPGGIFENRACWYTKNGLWMYTFQNQLWKFDISLNEWMVARADPPAGTTLGGEIGWTDNDGNLWRFGGHSAPRGLYRFMPDSNCGKVGPIPLNLRPDTTLCIGDCISLYADFIEDTCYNYIYSWASHPPGFTSYAKNPGSICPDTTTMYYLTVNNEDTSASDSVLITVLSRPVAYAGKDTTICPGDSVYFHATGGDVVYWTPAESVKDADSYQTTVYPGTSTFFIATVTDTSTNCSGQDSVYVTVLEPLNLYLGNDTFICSGQQIILNAADSNAKKYIWSTDDTTSFIIVSASGTYWVIMEDSLHCNKTDTIVVSDCKNYLDLPSVFSPNNDGLNDVLLVFHNGIENLQKFKIFDRWGEVVFQTNDLLKSWDGTYRGKTAEQGIYYYKLLASTTDGTDISRSGSLLLLR